MRVFSHRMNIFPKEKVHETGIYSQMRIYSPNWESFPQWGKSPPEREYFRLWWEWGEYFPLWEKEGNIFPFRITTENIFPPFTPDPPLFGVIYLKRSLYLQARVSISEVSPKCSPENLGKIFPRKCLRENIPLEISEGKYSPRNVCRGRFSLFSK